MKSSTKYWLTIGMCVFLVFFINLIFCPYWMTLLYCAMALLIVIAPCIVFVTVIEFLPLNIFNPDSKAYDVLKFENKFYEFIGIKKWKDNIPVIKPIHSGFDKANLLDPKSAEYLYMFLRENIKAEVGHAFSIIWGFLCAFIFMFIMPPKFILTAYLPVLVVSTIVHFLSYSIQRYLRPRLKRMYNLTKLKEKHNNKE